MLYIGAEFCPYCAELRWSMAVALSRFGAFTTPLRGIHSSSTDVDPSTATLTFYKAGYTSKYLTFTPVENEKVNHSLLQATTPQQQAIWDKYDANSYPFIDFGNKHIVTLPCTTRRSCRARPGRRSLRRCTTRPAPSRRARSAPRTT